MSNSDLADQMTDMERRQQRQDQVIAEIHELLLLTSQRQAETTRIQQDNAAQIARNSEQIAELRALIELQTGNGHSG